MASLNNTLIIITFLGFIFAIIFYYIHKYRHLNKKDVYMIHKHILDNICEVYKKSIFTPKLEKLRKSHNLDSESQLNAIKAFMTAEDELLKKSSTEIYKMLTKENRECLHMYYSTDLILLIIIDNLRS